MTFSFDVDLASHDDLQMGVTARLTHRVTVLADSLNDASLLAAQLAAATHPDDMPTDTRLVL